MTYHGDLVGAGSYLVHGKVEGNGNIDGHLLLGPTAKWHGNISATHLVVAGEVTGDVYARARLELQATARVRGNITSPVIALAEGASYDGEIGTAPQPPAPSNDKRST